MHIINMYRQSPLIKPTYKPYTLVGPTITGLVQDPLAVLLLDNLLYIHRGCFNTYLYTEAGTCMKTYLIRYFKTLLPCPNFNI